MFVIKPPVGVSTPASTPAATATAPTTAASPTRQILGKALRVASRERAPLPALRLRGAAVIELSHIDVVFGGRATHRALDDVSLVDRRGPPSPCCSGPNGAGKTTLLRVLGRTLLPSRGTYRLDGKDVARRPQRLARHRIRARRRQVADDAVQRPREHRALPSSKRHARRAASRSKRLRSASAWSAGSTRRHTFTPRGCVRSCACWALCCSRRASSCSTSPRSASMPRAWTSGETLRLLRDEGRAVIVATHEIDFASSVFTNVVVLAAGKVLADLDDRAFRAVVTRPALRRHRARCRIPALAGWTSTRGEAGEIVLSRDGADQGRSRGGAHPAPARWHRSIVRLHRRTVVRCRLQEDSRGCST